MSRTRVGEQCRGPGDAAPAEIAVVVSERVLLVRLQHQFLSGFRDRCDEEAGDAARLLDALHLVSTGHRYVSEVEWQQGASHLLGVAFGREVSCELFSFEFVKVLCGWTVLEADPVDLK